RRGPASGGKDLIAMPETARADRRRAVTERRGGAGTPTERRLRADVETLERRVRKGDAQRRAMLHIMSDLSEVNKRLTNQRKATEIISHLRTFGRAAPVSREPISLRQVIEQALSLVQEQLHLREVEVTVDLGPEEPVVLGNPIQLEQVFINLLTNARDAVADA